MNIWPPTTKTFIFNCNDDNCRIIICREFSGTGVRFFFVIVIVFVYTYVEFHKSLKFYY